MIKKWFMLILTFCCISGKVTAQNDTVLKLWYDSPARQWVEALPLGNGSLGAMVFGDPIHERLQLNEETVWGGSPHNNTNPKAKEALPRIRQLIFEGKIKKRKSYAALPSAHNLPMECRIKRSAHCISILKESVNTMTITGIWILKRQ